MIDFTKPCELNGKPVRILCTDRPSEVRPIVYMTETGGVATCKPDGTIWGQNKIVNAIERKSMFGVILTSNRPIFYSLSSRTLDEARKSAKSCIGVIGFIEVKFEDNVPVETVLHGAL